MKPENIEKSIKTYKKAITARKGLKYFFIVLASGLLSVWLKKKGVSVSPEILTACIAGTIDVILNYIKNRDAS